MRSGLVCRNGRPRASRHRAAAAAITPHSVEQRAAITRTARAPSASESSQQPQPPRANRRAGGASAERERVVAAAAAAKCPQRARRAPSGAHINALRASLPQRPAPSQPPPRRRSRDHTPLRRTTRHHYSIVELAARAPSASESSHQPQQPNTHTVRAVSRAEHTPSARARFATTAGTEPADTAPLRPRSQPTPPLRAIIAQS